MSGKLFFYDVSVLEFYTNLLDELINDQATYEWNMHRMENLQQSNKLSTFKLCNPFWLTYVLLRGICKFLFPRNNEVVFVKSGSIKYRDLNNFSDDDTDESDESYDPPLTISKGTQTDRRDLDQIGIENALTDLINMRKFKDIVPANRRGVRRMASHMNLYRRIDERNRYRFGGKVIKSKLKSTGSKIICRPKIEEEEMDTFNIFSVEVLNHLVEVESSDDENSC